MSIRKLIINSNRFLNCARAFAIALIMLTLVFFTGCAQYEYGNNGVKWEVKPWSFVRDWMKSSECYDWDDKFIGIGETGNGDGELFEVFFTPAWGSRPMM